MAPEVRVGLLTAVSVGPVGTAFDDTKDAESVEKRIVVLIKVQFEGRISVIYQQNCS
jgi:hypothetical protein